MIVLVVGDVVTDTIVRPAAKSSIRFGTDTNADITDSPGGQGANVARWLASTGRVTPRLLATISSRPSAGYGASEALNSLGIEACLIEVDAAPARVISVVEPDGTERSFFTQRGAAALLSSEHVNESVIEGVGWCHISGYLLATPAGRTCYTRILTMCQKANISVSLDPASVAVIEHIGLAEWRSIVKQISILLPNADEARLLTGEIDLASAAQSLRSVAETVVLTNGTHGSLTAIHDAQFVVPAERIEACDPTGAGDAFAAGLIAALATGSDLAAAVVDGTHLAARCVSQIGAHP